MKGGVLTFHTSAASLARLRLALFVGFTCWLHFTKFTETKIISTDFFFFLWAKTTTQSISANRIEKTLAAATLFPSQSSTSSGPPSGNETSKTVKKKKKNSFSFSYFFLLPSLPGQSSCQSHPISQNPQKSFPWKSPQWLHPDRLLCYFAAIIKEMKPPTRQS